VALKIETSKAQWDVILENVSALAPIIVVPLS